jgi:hypothetical protein
MLPAAFVIAPPLEMEKTRARLLTTAPWPPVFWSTVIRILLGTLVVRAPDQASNTAAIDLIALVQPELLISFNLNNATILDYQSYSAKAYGP